MTNTDLIIYAAGAVVLTGWIGILAAVGLKGWNGWLALKRAELDLNAHAAHAAHAAMQPQMSAATRIDVADLKERIRKLEAIASGVDL